MQIDTLDLMDNTMQPQFGQRNLMAWNKLNDGELAVMDNDGVWRSYKELPSFMQFPDQFEDNSKGWATYQMLRKGGWILVNGRDY